MMKYLIVPLACLIVFLVGRFPAFWGCSIENRFLYTLSHANVWHLIINIIGYWVVRPLIKGKGLWELPLVLMLGFAASFGTVEPTVGLSGALWGIAGISARRKRDGFRFMLFVVLLALFQSMLSHFAWGVHLLGFAFGYLIQLVYDSRIFRARGSSSQRAV